jgi:hypothetical protein
MQDNVYLIIANRIRIYAKLFSRLTTALYGIKLNKRRIEVSK